MVETQAVSARGAGLPDEELARRVVAGDRAAFEVLMRRHNPRVYRAIRSILRDEAEVEDAMQQTYLLAYAHLAQFGGASSLATWLTRIAINEALGRVRRRSRLVAVASWSSPEDDVTSRDDSPEEGAAQREAVRLVEHSMDALPEAYRTVLMLRDVDGLSTAETAEALSTTEEAVRVRLLRARRALRAAFAETVGSGLADAFPFHAPRCDRVVAGVLAALDAAPGSPR